MSEALTLTKMISDYGLAAIVALLVVTVIALARSLRWMFEKFEKSQQDRIEDGKLYGSGLRDAAKALEKSNELISDLSAQISELKLIVEHRSTPRRGP